MTDPEKPLTSSLSQKQRCEKQIKQVKFDDEQFEGVDEIWHMEPESLEHMKDEISKLA